MVLRKLQRLALEPRGVRLYMLRELLTEGLDLCHLTVISHITCKLKHKAVTNLPSPCQPSSIARHLFHSHSLNEDPVICAVERLFCL